MKCSKCNAEMPDGTKFCQECGEEIPADKGFAKNEMPQFVPAPPVVICRECGETNDTRYEFCQNCGAKLGDGGKEEQYEPRDRKRPLKKPEPKKPASKESEKGKPESAKKPEAGKLSALKEKAKNAAGNKKLIAALAAAVVLVAVLLIAIFSSGGKAGTDYVLFVRDKNISVASVKGKKLMLRTLTDNYGRENASGEAAVISEDGKRLFFIDDAESESGCALYYLDISGDVESGLPVRVSSGLRSGESYKLANGGKKVFFIRNNGTLCVCDLKKVTELYENVTDFWTDGKGEYVLFTAGEDGSEQLFEMKVKSGEAGLIDKNVEAVHTLSDMSAVFYIKDGSLYRRDKGGEKERLAAGVSAGDVTAITPSGAFYYVMTDVIKAEVSELVEDDRAQSDALMEEPQPPVYPRTADHKLTTGSTDWDAYHAAVAKYEELMDRYDKDYIEYEQRLARDALREEMAGMTVSYGKAALYYYDGEKSVLVNEGGCTPLSEITADGTLAYVRPAENGVAKLKLSEMESVGDVQRMLDELGGNDGKLYIARAGAETDSGVKAERDCDITKDGRAVWLDGKGIWTMKLGGEELTAELLLDSGSRWYETDGGKLLLFKKTADGYEMYGENGKLIDENVEPEGIISSGKDVYYLTDCSSRTQSGTLMRLNGSKTSKIEDDVYAFALTQNGNVAYLVNYSPDNGRGELAVWISGKKTALEERVSAIVPFREERGNA